MQKQNDLSGAIQSLPWFADLEPAQIERLAGISWIKEYTPSETKFNEGDPEDFLYFVLAGKIEIEMEAAGCDRNLVFTAEPSEAFGWSSVTPVIRSRTASAMAATDSRLLAIEANKLRQLCEADHDVGYSVMRHLADVIAARLLVTRLELLSIPTC